MVSSEISFYFYYLEIAVALLLSWALHVFCTNCLGHCLFLGLCRHFPSIQFLDPDEGGAGLTIHG